MNRERVAEIIKDGTYEIGWWRNDGFLKLADRIIAEEGNKDGSCRYCGGAGCFRCSAQQPKLSREHFRNIMCEYIPSIAEDSQQPEWTVGELDKAYDDLMGKRRSEG